MANNYIWMQFPDYDLANKKNNYNDYIKYMLNRTRHIFKYNGLPTTIPERELELQLQIFGHIGVFQHTDGNLYGLKGNLCGKPDPYYLPTEYIIANPGLNMSKNFKINEDIVIMRNDTLYHGLMPLIARTSKQMCENDLSMFMADINSRMITLISATDDNTLEAAKKYIRSIVDGKLEVVGDDAFFQGLQVNPVAETKAADTLTNLIEYQQYLKASLWNDLGLDANYNMKREAINSVEASMNTDALYPLIDDMMKCRQEGCEAINEMFGTNITVEYDGIWEVKDIEKESMLEQIENPEMTQNSEKEGGSEDETE